MIVQLYLDMAEETRDLKIYGKLLQACQVITKDLPQRRVVNELQGDLREMMSMVEP